MSKYLLSPNARKSLYNIKSYSLEQFGKHQTRIYLQMIEGKFQRLAQKPDTGKKREEIKKGYYSFLAGSHVIFYRKKHGHVEIIDILHQSMEPKLHLFEENYH